MSEASLNWIFWTIVNILNSPFLLLHHCPLDIYPSLSFLTPLHRYVFPEFCQLIMPVIKEIQVSCKRKIPQILMHDCVCLFSAQILPEIVIERILHFFLRINVLCVTCCKNSSNSRDTHFPAAAAFASRIFDECVLATFHLLLSASPNQSSIFQRAQKNQTLKI